MSLVQAYDRNTAMEERIRNATSEISFDILQVASSVLADYLASHWLFPGSAARTARAGDEVSAVSEDDRASVRDHAPGRCGAAHPDGVDIDDCAPRPRRRPPSSAGPCRRPGPSLQ
jgi:hypothetical protein